MDTSCSRLAVKVGMTLGAPSVCNDTSIPCLLGDVRAKVFPRNSFVCAGEVLAQHASGQCDAPQQMYFESFRDHTMSLFWVDMTKNSETRPAECTN